MNIAKHMEAIFIATIVIIGAAALVPRAAAAALVPRAAAAAPVQGRAAAVAVTNPVPAAPGKMQVVIIVGKRLSAADKSQLGE